MSTKLKQKHLFKGTQEFDIVDEQVNVRIKSAFHEETLSIMLTAINPEPVISKSSLQFNSRVNGEELLSLYIGKPNTNTFNEFVQELKKRAFEAYNAFTGLNASPKTLLNGNVDEEPPEFDDDEKPDYSKNVNVMRLEEAMGMIEQFLDKEEMGAFLAALENLKENPKDLSALQNVTDIFTSLGPSQGAILTFAPYIGLLMSDDPLW